MSTLAAARADNMYYPPEWRPEMGGISKFQGSKGSNQYEQYGKIRFELPVHGWCLGCGRHIGRGTRFNATKDQAGTYYTTKIWQFSMKCPSCSTVLVIRTDPKNTDYEYVEGIRKKDMAFDPEEAQTERVQDSEVSNKLAVDPLYRLEHEQADKRRAASRKTVLTRLTELADSHAKDDYSANAKLRKGMRSRKKKDREREEEAKARGLGIRLATPIPADSEAARGVKYRSRQKGFRAQEKSKMAAITGESIFGSGMESSAQARRKAVLVKSAKLGISTRGMRLLEPDSISATNAPCIASKTPMGATRASTHGSSTYRGGSGTRREERKRRRRHSETELRGGGAFPGAGIKEGFLEDAGVVVGGGGAVEGEGERGTSLAVRGSDAGGIAVAASKKRRKGGSSSRAVATPAASIDANASSASTVGGLAAIASLY